jgi:DNA polymerase-3 subunit epsilon
LHLGRKRTFYGMGYLDTEVTDLSEIREYVTPYPSNQYIPALFFCPKYPAKFVFKAKRLQRFSTFYHNLLIVCC